MIMYLFQNLLSLHILKGSELLYTFLTPYNDFSTGFFPDINLGKIMKSGALKLVKEVSTRFSDKDSDTASISSEKMSNMLFENNAGTDLSCMVEVSASHIHSQSLAAEVPIHGVCDTVIYLVEHLYRCQSWLIQLLLSIRIVARHTIDAFADWYLSRRLQQLMHENKVVQVIHLLRDVLFFDTDPLRSDEDKLQRKEMALQELKDYIPRLFVQAIGSERYQDGTELLFEVLQHPKLNKQLSYLLLDLVIEELFPELTQNKDPLTDLHERLYRSHDIS
ncbi:hypothetical protein LSH36_269g07046 [Paralvinella palmiformis]|uniref:Sorting nexin C-terminal domain-containing protein n=1 Tax=Paralvinella palmiformis TaxID=53620 RepID=A0AAD9N3U0_9ANNE|nr:hypothetical protein LSH36_269g07046 [Paralvinella palmiformis]